MEMLLGQVAVLPIEHNLMMVQETALAAVGLGATTQPSVTLNFDSGSTNPPPSPKFNSENSNPPPSPK